ncbi:hypothetical protein Q3V23_00230 [Streptomyces sp. VNUA116]|uniref:hypothetical protein n=1 Tax=Streptomyces sp. VNUA116 TaxID=3062449 RepID=UPI002676C1B4|nr:hypothetical protein [Streptomyces sp. VNUA116]WKU42624.1 hypothetical protein Q3V23_00230 [Streptomyces sp. VNUA116]
MESGERPLTAPEATVIVIVLVLSVVLALTSMPTLSVILLLTESTATGLRLARRLHVTMRLAKTRS